MLDALAAHGPEGRSQADFEAVSFGHRLLKIAREDDFEAQPLIFTSAQGQTGSPPVLILMVADARINNRIQLARDFEMSAGEMALLPDSAFVLRAWQRWGRDCIDRLIGAFAFAVWDATAQQLFLVRDHVGERPLYFRKTPESIAFATTASAILQCPGVSAELDEETLARDLTGLPPVAFHTRFRDVQALPPGHCLVVSREAYGAVPQRYWNPDALAPVRFSRDQDYAGAFLEIFDEAVGCRLRTTGSVATELSGGLDSGSVTASAARILATRNQRLTAFTSVPRPSFTGTAARGWIYNEGPLAAEVAELYPNIDHRLVDSSGSDLFRELARVFPLADVPVPAPMNQIWINLILDRAAAGGAKVLLRGAGGNVTISYGGNDSLHAEFRRGQWLRALRHAIELRRNGFSSGREFASLTLFSALPWPLRARIDPVIRCVSVKDAAIRPDRARDLDLTDKLRRYFFVSGSHLPAQMEANYTTNQYGEQNAITAAGWGIESRDPTSDKRVIEFCACIPLEQYVVGGQGRSLVRRAMRDRLPGSTLARRDRGIQAADWYESLTAIRAELAAELGRLQHSPGARRLLDLDRLRSAVEHWPQSASLASGPGAPHPATVSGGIAVGYFIRRWEESAQARASHGVD